MFGDKPENARHLKNAFKHVNLSKETLKKLNDKAMDPHFIVRLPSSGCVLSTRTGSADMPQLKLEEDGEKTQILCTHAVALHDGKMPKHWYDELSHLCGIRQCLVHTKWELPWDNISRDGCHKYHHFQACPHDLPCLPEPPQNIVRQALENKRKTEEDAAANDPKKAAKKRQNQAAYKRKLEKLAEEKAEQAE